MTIEEKLYQINDVMSQSSKAYKDIYKKLVTERQFPDRFFTDLLLVIKVKVDGTWEELYFDDFEKALSIANFSKRDNKHSISITALKKIK